MTLPTEKVIPLKALTDAIKQLKGKTAKQYRKNAISMLNQMNLKFIGSGATCDVFSANNCEYVVKLSDEELLTFKPVNHYRTGYLRPSYISDNGLIAVQPKAETRKSIDSAFTHAVEKLRDTELEVAELNASITESMNRLNSLIESKVELGKLIGELTAKRLLCREENVENRETIPDIHIENIGIHKGRILCIDLNSQFKKTHYEKGERHD